MPYSSSLTDSEWALIEPLLPKKKRTKPPKWSKREILDGVLYQLKNGCNWCDFPWSYLLILQYSGITNSGVLEGVIEKIRDVLHAKVRQQVKKKAIGDDSNHY